MPFSVFEFFAERAEEQGLFWLLEFASLLFGTWTAALVGALLVVTISKIPNFVAMGTTAAVFSLAFIYLCLDAVLWRTEMPTGVAYPVLATVAYFVLVLSTWWNWRRGR